jgi:hypothetical protein
MYPFTSCTVCEEGVIARKEENKGMKEKKQELKREITYRTKIKAERQQIESCVLPQEVCSISQVAGGNPSSACGTRVLREHAA